MVPAMKGFSIPIFLLAVALASGPAAAATNPVQSGSFVDSVTRMPTPTVSIHVPMFETNAPDQNSAKERCRRGASDAEAWRLYEAAA